LTGHAGGIAARAREACDDPMPTGSPAPVITIGISLVARFAAKTTGVIHAAITSTFSRTNSAASLGSRSMFPSALRTSIRMFCPAT
jgi:hypothetical protein